MYITQLLEGLHTMETIKSFTVNHDILKPGIYISKDDHGIVTYDIRMKYPNCDDFLSTGSIHTMEHLFATYIRNTEYKEHIVYVGPMGCRTGFYLLTRDISHEAVITLVQDSFTFIADFAGDIPGKEKHECGNYLDHDLEQAKLDAKEYLSYLDRYSVDMLQY